MVNQMGGKPTEHGLLTLLAVTDSVDKTSIKSPYRQPGIKGLFAKKSLSSCVFLH